MFIGVINQLDYYRTSVKSHNNLCFNLKSASLCSTMLQLALFLKILTEIYVT